jgi:hypothetical protein
MVEFVPPNICDHTVTYMSQQSKGGVRRDKLIAKRDKADHIATLSKIATHEARDILGMKDSTLQTKVMTVISALRSA